MLTDSGCMLLYPLSQQRYHLLPEPLAFTTGTRPELLVVDPLLTAALVVLTGWAVDPAFIAAHWRRPAGRRAIRWPAITHPSRPAPDSGLTSS